MIEDVVLIMKDSLDELGSVMELLNQHVDDVMMGMIDQVKILMNELRGRMMTEKIDDSKK
jgi:hypothetical protein